MITKKIFVYCCAFNHSFGQNNFFLTKVIFIQFKELSKIFKDFCGKFKAFSRRGFDHATILSPSFHGLRKERLA